MKIPLTETKEEEAFPADKTGRVFRYDNQIYRCIYNPNANFFEKIFSSPLWEDLNKIGLVSTEVSNCKAEGFGINFSNDSVPIISLPSEWTSAMLKDAALLTCDIQLRLLESGYTLDEGHPRNVLFDACAPKFIAVGSICEKSLDKLDTFLTTIRSGFLYPLLLKHARLTIWADTIMQSYYSGIYNKTMSYRRLFYRILFGRIPMQDWFYHLKKDIRISRILHKSPINAMRQLREQIESIPETAIDTLWTRYLGDDESIDDKTSFWPKHDAVNKLLSDLRPKTVLDIGANKGQFSILAERIGARVIAADIDEFCLNELYHLSKEKNLEILPVRLDICAPLIAYRPWELCKAAHERFKSEMVMALALTHHLVQRRDYTFEDIARVLSSFVEKWLLVEFVGPRDEHVRSWDKLQIPAYNINAFQKALQRYFSDVALYNQVYEHRYLFLCTRH